MIRLLNRITDLMADSALLEMDVDIYAGSRKTGAVHETLEENLVEVAFAEAADYDDIHRAIMAEHEPEMYTGHPDECQYGDNDVCFV